VSNLSISISGVARISAVHLYNTRERENLHLDSVTTNYGKRTVKYKASKMWNQLPSFLSVKNFSNKFKKVLANS